MHFSPAFVVLLLHAGGALSYKYDCQDAATLSVEGCCAHDDNLCDWLQYCGANYLTWSCSDPSAAASQYCSDIPGDCLQLAYGN
ncbi:hypothetical protein V8C35DRAFT_304946 [Trichoderma chlorosporum]